jgi:hypothetical protein
MIAYLLILIIGLRMDFQWPFWVLWGIGAGWHFLYWASQETDE